MPPSSILGLIAKALQDSLSYSGGAEGAFLPAWEIPLQDTRYLPALESVVRELARSPTIVIRGRGSQFILRDHPAAFHVLVVAPLEVRMSRVMTDLKLDQESAKKEIVRFDNSRREFIRKYFKAELEDPVFYDLTINTGKLDLEAVAAIVIDALSFKMRS
jgi:cytidylate kinase